MSFLDTLRLALGNLAQARLRTVLTMLGVSIGIAFLAVLVSFGVGLEDQLIGRFTQSGVFDSITVTSAPMRIGGAGRGRRGGPAGGGPAPGGDASAPGRGARTGAPPSAGDERAGATPRVRLDDEAIAKLEALPNVTSVYPSLRIPLQVSLKDFSEFTAASGVPMTAAGDGPFQRLSHGAFFANDRDDACLISLEMAKRISEADPKALIGQNLTLAYAVSNKVQGSKGPTLQESEGPRVQGSEADAFAALGAAGIHVQKVEVRCPIVGIVEREPAPGLGGSSVSALMIPLARARAIEAVQVTSAQSLLRRSNDPRDFPSVTVKVSAAQHTQDVQDKIKAMGYSAFSLNDLLDNAKRAFLIIDILLSIIGSIALAVSSLGIVNTMLMSILQRTREIGIMKAIGGSDRDIRKIFLIEATTIGLLGGVAGIALGWMVGRVINFGANVYIERQGGAPGDLFSMPLWLIGGAIGFSVLVSLLAGSYPARRAARLDPIQALRHD